jgi:hypothetical protein
MAKVWYLFQACGAASWLVLLVAILATPLSIVGVGLALGRVRAARIVAGIAVVVALLPVGIGAAGTVLGRAKVDAVLASAAIDPLFRERIRVEGYQEADGCTLIGLGFGALPLVMSLVALGLALALSRKRD